LWLGELVSVFGSQFFLVAIPWLIASGTALGRNLSLIMACGSFTRAIVMPLGGIATDRSASRNILLLTNLARGVLSFALGYMALAASAPLVGVALLMLAYGCADGLFYPAFLSAVPRLVPGEYVHRANSSLSTLNGIATSVGPAIAGVFISRYGLPSAFLCDGLSFCFAGVSIVLIRSQSLQTNRADNSISIAKSLANGLQYVWRHQTLRAAVFVSVLINTAIAGPYMIGTVLRVKTLFNTAPGILGLLFSASGVGVLIGALCAAMWYPKRQHTKATVNSLVIVIGGALALLAYSSTVVCIVLGRASIGMALGYLDVLGMTVVQQHTTPPALGRVVSLFTLTMSGVQPLSYLISGLVASSGAIPLLLLSAGIAISSLAFTRKLNDDPNGPTAPTLVG
jgi:MFS family permease